MFCTFQGGGWYLLGVQIAGVLCITVWTFILAFILLKTVDLVIGLRVSLQYEILGADLIEHAVGDIEFDKKSNSIINLRKNSHVTRADFADANDDHGFQNNREVIDLYVPEFNQTHKRRRATIYAKSVQNIREVDSLDRSFSFPARTVVNDLRSNADSNSAVFEMQSPVVELHKHPNKNVRMRWRYAAESALNKTKRKETSKNTNEVKERVKQVQSSKNNSPNLGRSISFPVKKRSDDFDLNRTALSMRSISYPLNNEDVQNQNVVDDIVTDHTHSDKRNNLYQSHSAVYTIPSTVDGRFTKSSSRIHTDDDMWKNGQAGRGRQQFRLPIRRRKEIKDDTCFTSSNTKLDSSSISGVSSDTYYHLDDDNIYGTSSIYI